MAAAEELRSGSRSEGAGSENPARHVGHGADRHRSRAGHADRALGGGLPARRPSRRLSPRWIDVRRTADRDRAARTRAGGDCRRRPARRQDRHTPAGSRSNQEAAMRRRPLLWGAAGLVVIGAASTFLFAVPALPDRGNALPTTHTARGPLKLTAYATGEIRAGRTATLVVPPAGGTLRL